MKIPGHTLWLPLAFAESISEQARLNRFPIKFKHRSTDPSHPIRSERYVDKEITDPFVEIALISSLGPGLEADNLRLDEFWYKVLKLQYDDIFIPMERYVLFTEQMANQVLDFIIEVENNVDEIWAHCQAGVSRSAAICKYISAIYHCGFPNSYTRYNPLVYYLLVKVHNERVDSGKQVPGKAITNNAYKLSNDVPGKNVIEEFLQ